MNRYIALFYLSIVLVIVVVVQLGIRNPWDPIGALSGKDEKKFEWMSTKKKREKAAMEKAYTAMEQSTAAPRPDAVVRIPAGTFLMGSSEEGQNSEKPVRTVYLGEYEIDQYEVSMDQFYAFVAATGHRKPRLAGYLSIASVDLPAFLEPNKPVVGVAWLDALTYCIWRGKRLPSEAEWEKAANGRRENRWPWGNTQNDSLSNMRGVEDGFHGTAPVDSLEAGQSDYGAYNMAGNVMEWVNDWYDEHYYSVMPGENPPGPSIGDEKVIRGGSWHDSLRYSHTYSRFKMLPEYRDVTIGFRCARSVKSGLGLETQS